MLHVKCPHCKQDIELFGSLTELAEAFSMSPNTITARMDKGLWPQPDLALGNRLIWERLGAEKAYEDLADKDVVDLTQTISRKIEHLSPEQREKVLSRLAQDLNNGS